MNVSVSSTMYVGPHQRLAQASVPLSVCLSVRGMVGWLGSLRPWHLVGHTPAFRVALIASPRLNAYIHQDDVKPSGRDYVFRASKLVSFTFTKFIHTSGSQETTFTFTAPCCVFVRSYVHVHGVPVLWFVYKYIRSLSTPTRVG